MDREHNFYKRIISEIIQKWYKRAKDWLKFK